MSVARLKRTRTMVVLGALVSASCAADGSRTGQAAADDAASNCLLLSSPSGGGKQQLPSLTEIFRRCRSSVVNVAAARELADQRKRRLRQAVAHSLGSGFVFDQAGHVLTCASVVEGAQEIEVLLFNGRRLPARLLGRDREMDLAVLAIDPLAAPTPLELGDSARLRPGQWVASFGYPFGLSHSLTAGIVSTVRRADETHPAHGLIVSDAAVNPGSNGGPLVDMQGRVVGINLVARGELDTGSGLAIPVNDARSRLASLVQGKAPPPPPWLGVSVQSLTAAEARALGVESPRGARITRVVPESPAARAGLQPDDIVLALGDTSITSADELVEAVRSLPIDSPVWMEVARGSSRLRIEITPIPRPR